jgi:hypothetical protein
MGVGLKKTNRERERERERDVTCKNWEGQECKSRSKEKIDSRECNIPAPTPKKNMKVPPPNCTIELNKVLEMMEKQLS